MDAIDEAFTRTVGKLRLVAQAPGVGVKPARKHVKPGDDSGGARPSGEGSPTFLLPDARGETYNPPRTITVERLVNDYNAASSDRRRGGVLHVAERVLERAQKTPPAPDPQDWEREVAVDPRPSRVVGAEHSISHTRVLELRKKHLTRR